MIGDRYHLGPAYWRTMLWDDFALYVWHRHDEIERKRQESGDDGDLDGQTRRRAREASRAPTRKELGVIPWSGEGPDPLLEEFA